MKWALLAIGLAGCSAAETRGEADVIAHSIACHKKTLAVATASGTCIDTLTKLEQLIASDSDCVAVYKGAGSGLHCVEHEEGGADADR